MAIEKHSSDFTSLMLFRTCSYPVNIQPLCYSSLIQAIPYPDHKLRGGSPTSNWCHTHSDGINFWGSFLGSENIPMFICLHIHLSDLYNSYHCSTCNFAIHEQTFNSNFYVLWREGNLQPF